MASIFAWLDHSEGDRRKALDVVDLFREQDTRDELGIGTVRDALADSLFPGISTIQTRAKYLLFIPWIYKVLEAGKTKSSHVARLARRHEIDLIYQLLKSDDTDGVIGKDAKAGLQRLPSSVYWAGLSVFGIRRYQGSLDQYHRSLDGFSLSRRQIHASAEDGVVELFKPQTNWHEGLPPALDGFPEGASLHLKVEEAEYLHQQIMTNVPGTLIAFLVDQGDWWDAVSFPWHHPQVGKCANHVKVQLHHAELFSLVMLGAALLYNLMLAEKRASSRNDGVGLPEGLVGHYRSLLGDWYGEVEDKRRTLVQWVDSRSDFWEIIHRVNPRIPIPTVHFINTWTDLAAGTDGVDTLISAPAARDLIHHRERRLKLTLARLDNPRALEMWSGAAGTQQLTYRWQQAQTIVQDILRGLGRG
ncbi:MAG: DUF6361 family protein [Gammaproteobacteria bacterium]|nr:DUF6361 family protein [Gammaproteobacteria bacterium]